ncbi:HdeD family acid-resistance protein [Mangrovimonas aestuarii]|uniref:HdeD family acid-resistance protein n=1 Tax=Mangrovimonas aestuarii TaxID=3018443 RepID=UPI002379511E|nr:HdeD family acid-resistance protein [Mangrovimonas aestuarii]
MKDLNKFWWLEVLRGIVMIILAILIFRHPLNTIVGLALYIGISLLITGIIEIVGAIQVKNFYDNWRWGLAVGILEMIFAFVLLSNPGLTAATIPFVVGLWLIIHGVLAFSYSFREKKEGYPGWGWSMFLGILTVIFGFCITNNIIVGMLTITSWMGIGFLIAGIFTMSIGFFLKPKVK